MTFKIIIGEKGKAWRLELDSEVLVGRSIGNKIEGADLNNDLKGYEFEISGGSDFAGFPMYSEVEGVGLKKVLFKKGWGMHDSRNGIRLRKTVRGKTISDKIVQINMILVKEGNKSLDEIFPDQNKTPEKVIVKKDEKDSESSNVEVDKKEDKKDELKEKNSED